MITDNSQAQLNTMEAQLDDFSLTPYFLLRVPSLPFAAVERIQFSRTFALVEECMTIEAWQREYGERLHNALREQLAGTADRLVQHKGLDMRRAMMSQNGQKVRALLASVAPFLSDDLVRSLEMWCQHCLRRAEIRELGEATLLRDTIDNRKMFHKLFLDERFQHGLLLSSEILYNELQNYLRTPIEKNNNRVRRTEEGLLSYYVRMATKTSPYSSFCSTALGSWSEQPQSSLNFAEQDQRQQRTVRLNMHLFQLISRMLFARREIRPYLYVVCNSTLRWLDEESEVENEQPKIEVLAQERIKRRRFDYSERLLRIRTNPLVRAILATVKEHDHCTYQHLLEHVTALLIASDAETTTTHEESLRREQQKSQAAQKIEGVLEHLLSHAVLTLDLRIASHEDDKLRCLIERMTAIPGQWVESIRFHLTRIYNLASMYASSSPSDGASVLREIRAQSIQLCQEIASTSDESQDAIRTINKLYPSLILEDAILPHASPVLERRTWEPVLQDARVLQEIAPLMDVDIVSKMQMDNWAGEAMTQEEAFIIHYLRFWQEFMAGRERSEQSHADERDGANFVHLHNLMQEFIGRISQQVEQARQTHARAAYIDPGEIHRFAQSFPSFLKQQATLACFGQFFIEDGQPRMVLNANWAGPSTTFSRFSHLFTLPDPASAAEAEAAAGVNPTFARRIQAYTTQMGERHNVIYASIAESGDINVNAHGVLTPYEIVFPFSASQHAPDRQIPLNDLYTRFDRQQQEIQLFSRLLKRQIKPLHLGFSLTQMMPPLYQALVMTTVHYPMFDMVTLLEARLKTAQKKEPRHYPRVVFGHIVLNRECWRVPVPLIPQRDQGETMFDYFLKMNRWRVEMGLPVTCFRRIVTDTLSQLTVQSLSSVLPKSAEADERVVVENVPGQENEQTEVHNPYQHTPKTLRKPFYMDFHNFFLLSLLNTLLKSLPPEATLTFEEVLPAFTQPVLQSDGQGYATECVFELSK